MKKINKFNKIWKYVYHHQFVCFYYCMDRVINKMAKEINNNKQIHNGKLLDFSFSFVSQPRPLHLITECYVDL